MNEFDQFIKHELRVKHYVRYTDDFILVHENREYLENILPQIDAFLREKLALTIHPQKITLRKFHQGIDFLGYVSFPSHRLLRTKTKRRIIKKVKQRIYERSSGKISEVTFNQSVQSYLGVLSHADSYELGEYLKNLLWFEG